MKKYTVHIIWLVVAIVVGVGGFFYGRSTAGSSRRDRRCGDIRFIDAKTGRGSRRGRYLRWADQCDGYLEHHASAGEWEFGGGVLLELHAGIGADDGFAERAKSGDERDGGGDDKF